ncbi:MAG: exodeoxyribonuclease III [Pseudomonadota bacterium]|nr:exodeoxyribonuclease III [Pseudomonadota bacterium]
MQLTLIATWNVNSVRARLPRVLEWLDEFQPDIALLQELKATEETFPRFEIESRGYNIEIQGQKNFNGVGILSKTPIENVTRNLPNSGDDEQARYIEAVTAGIRVASIYLPNGNPAPGDKYDCKLHWMELLYAHMEKTLQTGEAIVFGGDYNIIPADEDVYDPEGWAADALCLPESRNRFRRILYLGLTDAYRVFHKEPHKFSFWDYQRGAWQKDFGVRIDHLLLSPHATDRLLNADIDRGPRGKEKPSDHTPVWCELK